MPLPKTPQISTLDHLPLEILLHILQNLDIPTLRIIIRIYRRSRIIFAQYHTQIISHILSAALPDPDFPLYFPYIHNDRPYPLPTSLPPLRTSHAEAYTHLRYAKSLISLSSTLSTLTTHIYSAIATQVIKRITPRSNIIPLNRSAEIPYEQALTSTIHRTLIINAQTLFYNPNPNVFSKSSSVFPPPRPFPPEYPESVARRLLPEHILPKSTPSDDILLQLSNTHDPETPLIKQTHRFLRRLILRTLTTYLKHHRIFKEVCIIPSWEYMRDSVSVRDELFFYLGVHPDLLLKVMIQCNLEHENKGMRRTKAGIPGKSEKREERRYLAVSIELGKAYSHICKITHEFLEQRKGNGDSLSDGEEGVLNNDGGVVVGISPLPQMDLDEIGRLHQEIDFLNGVAARRDGTNLS
ncbi:hypothetical protein TWF281_006841 [Arthrobotrys megalospora]